LFVNEYDTNKDFNDQRLLESLINIKRDDFYCFDCVGYRIESETLESFIKKQSIEGQRDSDADMGKL